MSKIIISDVLNNFVKPTSEDGYGIPTTVVEYMTESRSYTSLELYNLYTADESLSSDAKALDYKEFKKLIDWMIDKEFDGKTITDQLSLEISYNQEDSFGTETMTGAEGTDNGDGTRTVTMAGWKPDGTQIRWGVAYPITADTNQFSSLNSTVATFTGTKGETYTLLLSCYLNNQWQTKEFTIGFAS